LDGSDTATAVNGNDSFDMTDWGVRDSISYLDAIKFNIDEKTTAQSAFDLKSLKVTQVNSLADTAVDTATKNLNMALVSATPTEVVSDLNLSTEVPGSENISITWETNKASSITNKGVVTRGVSDEEVILTAKISDATTGFEKFKEFKLNVKAVANPNTPELIIARAKEALVLSDITSESAGNITKDLIMPLKSTWHDELSNKDVAITWTSSNTAAIGSDGKFKMPKPTETQNIDMVATLALEGRSDTKTFSLMIQKWEGSMPLIVETFTGKTIENNILPNWEIKESAGGKGINSIIGDDLVLKKSSAAATTKGEFPKDYFWFNCVKVPYTDETGTEVSQDAFNGKYKLEFNIKPHITTTTSFVTTGFTGGTVGEEAKAAFPICIHADRIDIYVSSGNYFSVATGNFNDKNIKLAITVDTKSSDVKISVNNEAPVTFTSASVGGSRYFLKGAFFGLKEDMAPDNSFTISSVKLSEIEAYDATADGAIKTVMDSIPMSSLTTTPKAVVTSLSPLSLSKNGVDITWNSSDTSIIKNDGTLVERPFDKDHEIIMKATFEKDGALRTKTYKLLVPKENDANVILAKAAAAVDYSNLTNDDIENLNTNLNLPSNGLNGTTITWSSSNTTYMTDAGVIAKHDDNIKKEVIMTATFALNGVTLKKPFTFHISVKFGGNLAALYKTDFTGDKIAPNIEATAGVGTITQADEKMYLKRTTGGSGTVVNIYPASDDLRLKITDEIIVETDVLQAKDCEKSELVLYDSAGKKAFTIYTGTLSGHDGYTYVASNTSATTGDLRTRVNVGDNVDMNMKVKCQLNPKTNRMSVWMDLGEG
ncbi:MAG: hypothetical protein RR145_02510, partial [Oscillospiraceae bacterium]